MRTEASGVALPSKPRPQVYDDDRIPVWKRYAKLRTQLYPYIAAADARYRRTGLPLMRHLALAYPGDARAVARDDEFLFGPDLLAAPVVGPGARERAGLPAPRSVGGPLARRQHRWRRAAPSAWARPRPLAASVR